MNHSSHFQSCNVTYVNYHLHNHSDVSEIQNVFREIFVDSLYISFLLSSLLVSLSRSYVSRSIVYTDDSIFDDSTNKCFVVTDSDVSSVWENFDESDLIRVVFNVTFNVDSDKSMYHQYQYSLLYCNFLTTLYDSNVFRCFHEVFKSHTIRDVWIILLSSMISTFNSKHILSMDYVSHLNLNWVYHVIYLHVTNVNTWDYYFVQNFVVNLIF